MDTKVPVSGPEVKKWTSNSKYLWTMAPPSPNKSATKLKLKPKKSENVSGQPATIPYRCAVCDKCFPKKYGLDRHSLLHNIEDSKCVCESCDKKFATKEALVIHERIHTGDQPYGCGECPKKFSSQSALNRHSLSHKNARSFMCEQCGEAFNMAQNLKRHMGTHILVRKFNCDKCRQRFKRDIDLKRHQLTHQEVPSVPCPLPQCEHQFRRKDNLLRHLRLTHNQSTEEANETVKIFNTSWKGSECNDSVSETAPGSVSLSIVSEIEDIDILAGDGANEFQSRISGPVNPDQNFHYAKEDTPVGPVPQIPLKESEPRELSTSEPQPTSTTRISVTTSVIRLAESAEVRNQIHNQIQTRIQPQPNSETECHSNYTTIRSGSGSLPQPQLRHQGHDQDHPHTETRTRTVSIRYSPNYYESNNYNPISNYTSPPEDIQLSSNYAYTGLDPDRYPNLTDNRNDCNYNYSYFNDDRYLDGRRDLNLPPIPPVRHYTPPPFQLHLPPPQGTVERQEFDYDINLRQSQMEINPHYLQSPDLYQYQHQHQHLNQSQESNSNSNSGFLDLSRTRQCETRTDMDQDFPHIVNNRPVNVPVIQRTSGFVRQSQTSNVNRNATTTATVTSITILDDREDATTSTSQPQPLTSIPTPMVAEITDLDKSTTTTVESQIQNRSHPTRGKEGSAPYVTRDPRKNFLWENFSRSQNNL